GDRDHERPGGDRDQLEPAHRASVQRARAAGWRAAGGRLGCWGEVLAVRTDGDRLHDLAVHSGVVLASTEPRDVVVAGAAVERIARVCAREGGQAVFAVATELMVDAASAPEKVALGAAVQRVVTRTA